MKTVDEFSPASQTGAGAGVSALVVDDEAPVRRFVARVLAREAYTVLEAADGLEALDLVKSGKGHVDVVVADIVMPRMNGVELMQALSLNYPDLPIILMSGYAAAALSELGIAPPCGILNKPFPAERLLAEVHRCVSGRNGGSSAA
jgi:CheY-like chemotaxis protein